MVSLRRLHKRFPVLCTAPDRSVELADLARGLAGELRELRAGTVAFRVEGMLFPQELLALFAPERRLAVLNGEAEYRDYLHAAAVRLARPVMGRVSGAELAELDGELAKWRGNPLLSGGSGALAFVRNVLGRNICDGIEAALEAAPEWRGMTIRNFISAGSTSLVCRVRRAGGKEGVLKVPRPGAEARFRREIELLRRFDHPNLPKLREWSLDDTPYCVMDICRTGRAAGDWTGCEKALVSALEYVHDSGLVHGDIRRCNLGIDPAGVPLLLDFSHARAAASAAEPAEETKKMKRLFA